MGPDSRRQGHQQPRRARGRENQVGQAVAVGPPDPAGVEAGDHGRVRALKWPGQLRHLSRLVRNGRHCRAGECVGSSFRPRSRHH